VACAKAPPVAATAANAVHPSKKLTMVAFTFINQFNTIREIQ
jgi:hypothetical protein